MKQVGILTVHRSLNYGAVLQAYALIRVLNSNGYSAQIVDYISEAVLQREHKSGITIKEFLKRVIWMNKYVACKNKENKFQEFARKHYTLSSKSYDKNNIQEAEPKYDYFVTGSDQIWNFDITNSDTVFMLDFVSDCHKKKSYAASFGYDKIPDAYCEKTKKMLSQYSSLLVRENSGVQILQRMGLEGKMVLDPTLLLNRNQWLEITRPNYNGEKYILVYTVAAPTHLYKAAKNMAKKMGVKIKVIKLEPARHQNGMKQIYDAGPIDFISLIKNAECVFTTSFHGLAFSLNLGKEVYFEADEEKNKNTTRLIHLAELLEVINRRIKSDNVDDLSENPINWAVVYEHLKLEREKSTRLLLESLSN